MNCPLHSAIFSLALAASSALSAAMPARALADEAAAGEAPKEAASEASAQAPKSEEAPPARETQAQEQKAAAQDADPMEIHRGDWTFRPRLDVRLRGERRENLSLDRHANQRSDLERFMFRLALGVEVKWRFLELSTELADARELVHDADSNTYELDLNQLYLGLNRPGGLPLNVRIGRQNWNFGSKRLVSSTTWGNKKRAWDGLWAEADFGGRMRLQAFGGSVVDVAKETFDYARFDEILYGAFLTSKVTKAIQIEVYLFGLYRDAWRNSESPIRGEDGQIGSENRVTPGIRAFGKFDSPKIDWDFEGAFQVGSRADDSIHAFAIATGAGWTMPLDGAPRLALNFSYASGDPDPEDGLDQTFVPLYGSSHSPYGIADLFRWQNMFEVEPSLTLCLSDSLTLRLEYHAYWLAETTDEWVNSSGKILRQGTGSESHFAGQEVSAVAKWDFSNYLAFEAGVSKFIGGAFMRDTGDRTGALFGYLQAIIRL